MTDDKKRFECYLNIQKTTDGVKGDAMIVSGTAETAEEAKMLFDHALESYRENKEK